MLELIILFGTHFIADLVLQPRCMAKQKSENFGILCGHTFIILVSFFISGLIVFRQETLSGEVAFIFALAIAIVHGFQDFIIWKGYKNFTKIRIMNSLVKKGSGHRAYVKDVMEGWKYWEDYWFYVIIGLDQLLHFIWILVMYDDIRGG